MNKPPLIFVSYSHKDDEARQTLDTHMAQLKREGVEVWFDGDLLPGDELDPNIQRVLKRADIFVALASPHYLHSTYCYDREYGYAIRKAARKKIHVVVAILRACQWRHTRMARYKLLPKDGRPIDQWARRGDAYEDIVEGIRAVVKAVIRDGATAAVGTAKPRRRPAKLGAGKPGPKTKARTGEKPSKPLKPKAATAKEKRGSIAREPAARSNRPAGGRSAAPRKPSRG